MGPEQNKIDVDPVKRLVIDAVAVINRKGTRENRKKAYAEWRKTLSINEDDTSDEKNIKTRALFILEEMHDDLLLDDQGPNRPDLVLHRGSSHMAKDPRGKR